MLVLDNEPSPAAGHGGGPVPAPGAPSGAGSHQEGTFSPDEQFAARSGDEPVPTSHVTHLEHPGEVVAQYPARSIRIVIPARNPDEKPEKKP